MKRDQRFPVVLSKAERATLQRLANQERLSASAVVRRLIWHEARRLGLLPVIAENREVHSERQ